MDASVDTVNEWQLEKCGGYIHTQGFRMGRWAKYPSVRLSKPMVHK